MVRIRVPKRRRREGKTDYKLRLGLLKSGMPRIVIRKTNKYLIAQLVRTERARDYVITSVSSRQLVKGTGIEGSAKSIPLAYFTGLLLGKKIKKLKDWASKEFILDLGMYRIIKGNRLFALAKGLIDAGLKVRVDQNMFPSQERLMGEHLKPEVKSKLKEIKTKIENEWS